MEGTTTAPVRARLTFSKWAGGRGLIPIDETITAPATVTTVIAPKEDLEAKPPDGKGYGPMVESGETDRSFPQSRL